MNCFDVRVSLRMTNASFLFDVILSSDVSGAGRFAQVVESAQPARRDGARAAHDRGARVLAARLARRAAQRHLPQPHLHTLPLPGT